MVAVKVLRPDRRILRVRLGDRLCRHRGSRGFLICAERSRRRSTTLTLSPLRPQSISLRSLSGGRHAILREMCQVVATSGQV